MPVRIVTDSSADLPADDVAELGVEVVPLSIRFGSQEYTDGVDLSVGEFYDKLSTSADLPETAAPAPGAFEAAFRRQAEAGADAVVCINLSSGLSATIQSAQNAATAVAGDLDVRVVDSRSITSGLGTMVREGYLLYGSSKAAAESAMAVLAADLAGSGVTSNVLVPGGTTDTPLVGDAPNREKMLKPTIMTPPLLWLLSDEAKAVNGKRFIAADWDTSLPPAEAAEKAGAPIAWLNIARMPIEPT